MVYQKYDFGLILSRFGLKVRLKPLNLTRIFLCCQGFPPVHWTLSISALGEGARGGFMRHPKSLGKQGPARRQEKGQKSNMHSKATEIVSFDKLRLCVPKLYQVKKRCFLDALHVALQSNKSKRTRMRNLERKSVILGHRTNMYCHLRIVHHTC